MRCCVDPSEAVSRIVIMSLLLVLTLSYPCLALVFHLSKLQRVQNCLARVILRAPRFSPSLPLLKQLHWLPVNYRIKFKLCTLTFRALAIHQPPYLASLLHFSNIPRQLRSSTSQQLSIPRTKLNLGKRAFSVAAPIIWNELPTTLKSCESLASFRKNLKTYLFKIAFPP